MKAFKRILALLSVCVDLCILTGCDRTAQVVDALSWEIKAKQIANEQAEIILECFKTGNSEELEALFCENISSSHDLKAEIAEAIEFIDGNIIDNGTWTGMSSAGESVDDGEITKLDICPSMRHVKTDTGKEYLIWFDSYLIYEKEPNNIGMIYIIVKNEDKSSVVIGGDVG